MATSLTLRIGADLSQLNQRLKQAESRLKRFAFKAERIGTDLTTRVSLPIIGIGAAAVQSFAQFDRIEKGLAALGGSARAGGEQFQRLNQIVLDTRTTLDLRTAALGAQRLQGAGLSAAFAERTIKQLGIAATVSGSAIDDVGGVLRQFTQIIGKGKVEQEDLNSILDRMPALGALIKAEFGGVTAEAIRATGISMEEFVSRTVGAIEANESFQNVQGGLAKSFESFANAVQVGIAPLGEAIAKSLNLEENLQRLGEFIGNVSQKFADLSPNTQRFIVLSLAATAAVGPLSLGLGAVARSLPLLRSGFGFLLTPLTSVIALFGRAAKSVALFNLALKATGKPLVQTRILTSALGPKLGALSSLMFDSVGRAILLTKAMNGLRAALAVATGPIGLAVAAIALIAISIKKAYDNSSVFRFQLQRLQLALKPITDGIANLARNILPDLSISFESLGDVFNVVFGVIAGGISFLVEGFIQFFNTLRLVGTAIDKIFDGDFSGAGEALSQTLFNPSVLASSAKKAANVALDVFNETAAGVNTLSSPSLSGAGSGPAPLDLGSDGTELIGAGGDVGQATENVNKYFGAFANLSLEVERSSAAFDAFGTSLAELPVLGGVTGVSLLNQALQAYQGSIATVNEKQTVFGDSFDGISEKINLTKSLINSLIEQQLPGYQEQVAVLKTELAGLNEQQQINNDKLQSASDLAEKLGSVTSSAFDAVGSALKEGGNAFKAFGNTVLGSVRKAISAEIKLAVTTAAASALKSVPFPLNIALAAGAGAGAGALFNGLLNSLKIPALAEGGIATGATLALIGEGNESEAILPLSKLQGLINMSGGGTVRGQLTADGNQLVALIDTVRDRNNRSF